MLKGKDRSKLKSLAHDLKPVVNIGKDGLDENVFKSIAEVLKSRELIKIKILSNNYDDQEEIIKEILDETNSEFISHFGSIITIYKRKKENSKYNI
ncbi:MAG: ribosome assembly RNA-binding protein YhbY [Peptoniphilaceae bacterium]|nr:ribosome assembly RNA-binding protein YhbY [Peptoniphilaceae bacterium]MDD7383476.1 ribosome assembly RNA-binding protein YhbY [Peptoniphilaceae bacterium]MDY3738462.1 ribosome assembly RNA-binding protein YhbY [Peptoniphilaceae bacterium]